MAERKKRPKKYQLVVDLSERGIHITDALARDLLGERKLTCGSYTLTTNGGANKLWEVHEKDFGLRHTISTDSTRMITCSTDIRVPVYIHFVLTAEGYQHIKELWVEHAIGNEKHAS